MMLTILKDVYTKVTIAVYDQLATGDPASGEMVFNHYHQEFSSAKQQTLNFVVTAMCEFLDLDALDAEETGFMILFENEKEIEFEYSFKGVRSLIKHLRNN